MAQDLKLIVEVTFNQAQLGSILNAIYCLGAALVVAASVRSIRK